MNIAINWEAKKKLDKDQVPLKSLIVAMQDDFEVVRQSNGIIEKSKNITADILLMGGKKSQAYLKNMLDKIGKELSQAKRITIPNVGHLAADNSGRPELVANELIKYFREN